MQSFLVEAGIDRDEFRLSDGSGLSRVNLVTPAAVVKLLRYLHASEHRETWLSLLPVGGEDGTLRLRFQKTAAEGKIRGKTGTLGQVTALSGYAERGDGSLLAFSIMINNQGLPGADARALVDKLCLALVE